MPSVVSGETTNSFEVHGYGRLVFFAFLIHIFTYLDFFD